MQLFKSTHITQDDDDTLDAEYEQSRIDNLPLPLQRIAIHHQLDQWEARPSLVEQAAQDARRHTLRQ